MRKRFAKQLSWFKKYGWHALAVLVLLGALWPQYFSHAQRGGAAADSMARQAQQNQQRRLEAERAFVLSSARVEWQVNHNYYFRPDASSIRLEIEKIHWIGTLYSTGQEVDIVPGRHYILRDKKDEEWDAIDSFYFGLVPVGETVNNWDCDRVLANGCQFAAKNTNISQNPYQDTNDFIQVGNLAKNVSQKYKLVPVIKTTDGTHLAADSGYTGFTINWAEKRPAPNAAAEPGKPIPLVDVPADPTSSLTIDEKTPGPITATAVAVDTNQSAADNFITGILVTIVNLILSIILGLIRFFLWMIYGVILLPLLKLLLTTGGPLDASNLDAHTWVYAGWAYVRDFMNLFFILILIFAGVATMLRAGGYGLKKTIGYTVVMALAVNFSFLAGEIILNFAQIAMKAFITPQTIDEIRSGIDINWTNMPNFLSASSALYSTVTLLLAIVYEVFMAAVLAVLAALLLVRVVGAWLLLILAPGAYVLYITEQGRGYLKQWWHKFLSYAFFAPIMAFMIRLAAEFTDSRYFMGENNREWFMGVGGTSFGSVVAQSLQGVVALVILIAGMKISTKMGIEGANMVVNQAQRLAKGGIKSAADKVGMGYSAFTGRRAALAQKAADKIPLWGKGGIRASLKSLAWMGANLANPVVAKDAWKKYTDEARQLAYGEAVGEGYDALNRLLPTQWRIAHALERLPAALTRALKNNLRKGGTWTGFWKDIGKVTEEMRVHRVDDKGREYRGWDLLGKKTHYGAIAREHEISRIKKELEEAPFSEDERVIASEDERDPLRYLAWKRILLENNHQDGDGVRWMRRNSMPQPRFDKQLYQDQLREGFLERGGSLDEFDRETMHRAEVAENINKHRSTGEGDFDVDDHPHAASNFEGIRHKYNTELRGKGVDAANDWLIEYLQKFKLTQRDSAGHNVFVAFKPDGGTDATGIETISSQLFVIDDLAGFEKAIEDTKGPEWHNPRDSNLPTSFSYELTGARWAANSKKRAKRGSVEKQMMGAEAAAFDVQEENGEKTARTAAGKREVLDWGPKAAENIRAGRKNQERLIEESGLVHTDGGGYKPNFEELDAAIGGAPAAMLALPPEARERILSRARKMAELAFRRPDLFVAYMQAANLNKTDSEMIVKTIRHIRSTEADLNLGGLTEGFKYNTGTAAWSEEK